jgi:thiol:disulfide interchange protein DsbD
LRGKNGSWLTVSRVTLGFIELAAAVKFLSNADLALETHLLSRDVALCFWVALFLVAGMFLLGKINLGREEGAPQEGEVRISVPRMLSGAIVLAFSFYLAVGLFEHRPLGGWVDGLLPPIEASSGEGGGLTWLHDRGAAIQLAKQESKPLFVNYTGFACTNCRYMEGAVFTRPDVAALLTKMVRVELVTDGVRAEHEENRNDQLRRFKTAALPFYSIECAGGAVVSSFPSSTNDPEQFKRFLEKGLEEARCGPSALAEAKPLLAAHRFDGTPDGAFQPGKWNLINFWASWCGPCQDELRGFLGAEARELELRGQHFAAIAVEEDERGLASAKKFIEQVGLPASSALQIEADKVAEAVDARLGFKGSPLPFTVLIRPDGTVAWTHEGALVEAELKKVLTDNIGCAALALCQK